MTKRVPRTVTVAALLIAIPNLVRIVRVVRALSDGGMNFFILLPLIIVFACAVVFAVTTLFIMAIYMRQNWARWLLVVWESFHVSLFIFLPISYGHHITSEGISSFAPGVLAALVLFLPSANAWFRPGNSFESSSIHGSD